MRYDTLLFDIDNTLLDFDANEADSFKHMLADLGEEYSDELYESYHKLNQGIWKQIERKELTVEEGVNTRFATLMREYGKEVDGREWERVYRQYLNRGTQLMPDVREVLDELKKSYRLYIITNGTADTQIRRMKGAGLTDYFEEMFLSQDIGSGKPSPEFFDHVKSHIPGFDPSKTLVIGDSLTSDIKGGHDAGLDTCWITRDTDAMPEDVMPTYIIHKLTDIFSILT